MEEEKILECNQVPVILRIPEGTVRLEMTVTMLDENLEQSKALSVLSLEELIDARIKGEEYEEDNAMWVITEEGRAYLEAINGEQK